MLETIIKSRKRDDDYPKRVHKLEFLKSVLVGTLYDGLAYEFHQERDGRGEGGNYVPLRQRRPCVRYNLCRIVVEDVGSLVFGDRAMPRIVSQDATLRETLQAVLRGTQLSAVMSEAILKGSIGSVAVLMMVLEGRIFWRVMETVYLTPEWEPTNPQLLRSVTERYKVLGADLAERGYAIKDDQLRTWFWFQRRWDAEAETWFVPWPVKREDGRPPPPPRVDRERTVEHALGFCPIVWIRNLPGENPSGSDFDGACTFQGAIETQIEIEYQLSQAGRGLKYSSDPLLVLREPAAPDGSELVRSAGNALVVAENGDAKLLEIGGTAAGAVIDYVRALREMALESIHGNRADPQRLSTAQSGRAIELMNQGLLWLADNMRVSYGHGLAMMLRMVIEASHRLTLLVEDQRATRLPRAQFLFAWAPFYPRSAQERQEESQAIGNLRASGTISRETAVAYVADMYGAPNIDDELARIAADQKAEDARLAAQAAQTKATEAVPS